LIHDGYDSARLLSTLTTVQSKLLHLEEENSISRRRVRELELELEVCKREVARERTRVMEREDVIVQHQREVERASAGAGRKGKARARDVSGHAEDPELTKKYREIVEEKKGLTLSLRFPCYWDNDIYSEQH
jgi:hypothetical protein